MYTLSVVVCVISKLVNISSPSAGVITDYIMTVYFNIQLTSDYPTVYMVRRSEA